MTGSRIIILLAAIVSGATPGLAADAAPDPRADARAFMRFAIDVVFLDGDRRDPRPGPIRPDRGAQQQ